MCPREWVHSIVRLFSGEYTKQRRFTQKLRKLNDWQVLALNPGPLFSFNQVKKLIFPWTRRIKEVYRKLSEPYEDGI